jgi:acetyltransferase-like isoleucine patch superfamily enzyme
VSNTANAGNGSLRYAIACAIAGSTLQFDLSLNNQNIIVTEPLIINKNLNIITTDNITVSGSGLSSSVFTIESNKVVTLKGLNINCASSGQGRCITNSGLLTLEQMNLNDPVTTQTNSSILNQNNGQVTIKNNVTINK